MARIGREARNEDQHLDGRALKENNFAKQVVDLMKHPGP